MALTNPRTEQLTGSTLNLGNSSISVDSSTGYVVVVPAPTEGTPNPKATVFSSNGVATVETTAGVANTSQVSSAAGSVISGSGAGVTVYANIASLPLSGVSTGALGLVSSTNKLYIYSGGWYNIALINQTPSITSGGVGSYSLTESTNTVITLAATDPEGISLTWSYAVTSGNTEDTTVSQSNNVFTITPGSTAASFTLTFSVTDGVNIATDINSFSLTVADNNIKYVTSLINSDVDTTYIKDASNNSLVITENGDVRPSAFSPFKGGYYSNYFDGSGDYLRITDASLSPGTGNFTVEGWLYLTSDSVDSCFFDSRPLSTDNTSGFNILFRTSSKKITVGSFGLTYITSTNTVTANQWHHISVVRNSGTLQLFIDGTSNGSASHSTNLSSTDVSIGTNRSASFNFSGYISNFRIVAGTALYTSAFTPSTSPLTTTSQGATESEVGLLTCQSSRFIDNSTNDNSITVNGNTSIKPFNPFAASSDYATYGSAYFDGTGDYLEIADDDSLDGFDDFTIECWVYSMDTNNAVIIDRGWNGGAVTPYLLWQNAGGYRLYAATASGGWSLSNILIADIVTNRWNHIAITREGTSLKTFFNGTLTSTNTMSGTIFNAAQTLRIGGIGSGYELNGYISNVRIIKGTALYTSAFTPSTSPLTTTSQGATASEVSLLTLQTNKPVNNTKAVDKTGINTVTTAGDTHVGSFTPYTPFGHSVYFDGSGDYLNVSYLTSNFGTGDFTVELWVYPTYRPGGSDYTVLMDTRSSGTGSPYVFGITPAGYLYYYTGTEYNTSGSSTTVPLNTWTHVAISRSGTTLKIFQDGTEVLSRTDSSSITGTSTGQIVFGRAVQGVGHYYGYMSNLRIVKGTALYTSAFTPSTTALTPTAETSLLTCQSPSLIDNGPYRYTITRNGDAKVTSYSPFNPHTVTPIVHSVKFNGSDTYIAVDDLPDFGTGDFTVEAWIYPLAVAQVYDAIFTLNRTGDWNGSGAGLVLGVRNVHYAGSSNVNYSTSTPIGEWSHIAYVRNGTNGKVWLNGEVVATVSDSKNYVSYAPGIGVFDRLSSTPRFYFNGYISNLRVTVGTALYTSTFTPSTSPLTTTSQSASSSEVKLLACQSSTIVDSSAASSTLVATTNVTPSEFNKFGFTTTSSVPYSPTTHGGSAYFDGSGDYFSTNYSINWSTLGAYTIEFWVYHTSLSATNQTYFSTGSTGYTNFYNYSNGKVGLGIQGTNELATATGAIFANNWHHISYSYDGTTTRIFIDGVLQASGTSAVYSNNSAALQIANGLSSQPVFGYMSDIRFVKTALRTSNFIPPKQQSTPLASEILSLPFNDAAIYDSTTRSNIKTLGNAKVSHAVKKYGNGSMYFDGTGDFLTTSGDTCNMGTGDFTIEMWAYFNSLGSYNTLIGQWQALTTGQGYWMIPITSTGAAEIYYDGQSYTSLSNITVSTNQWYHLALTRSGNTFRWFVNGSLSGSFTFSGTFGRTGSNVEIGGNTRTSASGAQFVNGYIDDLRVTKGVARYTSAFTPPSKHKDY